MEQTLGRRHVHQADHFAAAAGLAEDGDVAGIAAEGFDVVVNPLEGGHQVGHAGVAGVGILRAVGRQIQRANDVQAVIETHGHYVAKFAQRLAVVRIGFHRRAVGESAAVHPYHHGFLCRRRRVLRPDVQHLAVFVLRPVAMREDEVVTADRRRLRDRADRSPCLSALDAFPGFNGLRHLEALRLGVGYAEEGEGLAVLEAAEFSALYLDHGRVQVRRRRSDWQAWPKIALLPSVSPGRRRCLRRVRARRRRPEPAGSGD